MADIFGVDYSRTVNGDWATLAGALKANGKRFAWRYAVNDLAPSGRGISAAEYAALRAAGIDVGVYWESTEGWMLGGFAAGQAAAKNAQQNIVAAGMPPTIPVYFAADFDATPAQQAPIDDCLKGAASVLGANRVGIYGGFWIVSRCAQNKTAAWFAQTSAWSGGQWFSGNHLEQYGYNTYFAGTNCDLVRAKQDNYGQASTFQGGSPVPTPKPAPTVNYPDGLDKGVCQRLFGSFKASNGVTVQFSEGEELSMLWLDDGSYGRLVDVAIYQDSPSVTRIYWAFSDGRVYFRPNASEPIRLMK